VNSAFRKAFVKPVVVKETEAKASKLIALKSSKNLSRQVEPEPEH
jgi:hypothetical protein